MEYSKRSFQEQDRRVPKRKTEIKEPDLNVPERRVNDFLPDQKDPIKWDVRDPSFDRLFYEIFSQK